MKRIKRIVSMLCIGSCVVAGALAGYKLATDEDLRGNVFKGMRGLGLASKQKINNVSEDVALKTARLTGNPKVNQAWVDNQWESLL